VAYFQEKTKNPKIFHCQEITTRRLHQDELDEESIRFYNFPHKQSCEPIPELKPQNADKQIQISSLTQNLTFLEDLVQSDPLKTPKFYRAECLKNHIDISLAKIKNSLAIIRKDLFPKEPEIIFSMENCQTLDEDSIKSTPFLQCRFSYIDESKKPIKKHGKFLKPKNEEIIIFASKFFVKILADAQSWYVDATFKVAPKNYYQLLIILCNHGPTNTNVPCFFILMTSKTEIAYSYVFRFVKTILQSHNYSPKVTQFMSDFKAPMRKKFREVFPSVEIHGCYFHFVKALWQKAAKIGMKQKKLRQDSKILMILLKFLAHIEDQQQRESFWNKIDVIFKGKNPKFAYFLKYFKSNWLHHYIVKPRLLLKN